MDPGERRCTPDYTLDARWTKILVECLAWRIVSDDIDTANSSTTIVTEGGTVHSTPTTENAEKRVSGRLSDPIVARIIQATDAPSKAEGHALEYDPALERGL